jgi:hypothetical protein
VVQTNPSTCNLVPQGLSGGEFELFSRRSARFSFRSQSHLPFPFTLSSRILAGGGNDTSSAPAGYSVVCNTNNGGNGQNTGTINFCGDSTCTQSGCTSQSFTSGTCLSNQAQFGSASFSVSCPEESSGAGTAAVTGLGAILAGIAGAAIML